MIRLVLIFALFISPALAQQSNPVQDQAERTLGNFMMKVIILNEQIRQLSEENEKLKTKVKEYEMKAKPE